MTLQMVAHLLSFQLPDSIVTGICVTPTLTESSKVLLPLWLTLLVAIAMVAAVCCWRFGKYLRRNWQTRKLSSQVQSRPRRSPGSDSESARAIPRRRWARIARALPIPLAAAGSTRSYGLGDSPPGSDYIEFSVIERRDRLDSDHHLDSDSQALSGALAVQVPVAAPAAAVMPLVVFADHDGPPAASVTGSASGESSLAYSDSTTAPLRARIIGASVNLCLSAYSTVTMAAMLLLGCVQLPGTPANSTWLYINGAVQCDYSGWQFPFIIVVLFLGIVPVLGLPFLARWARVSTIEVPTSTVTITAANRRTLFISDARWGIHRALSASYSTRTFWWESVLMVQRLLMAAIATFTPASRSASGVGVLGMAFISTVFLVAHVAFQPVRSITSHRLQVLSVSTWTFLNL
jgi:hypothetical protein